MSDILIGAPNAMAPRATLLRAGIIGLTAFLSLVDLFATQAILPSLVRAYHVAPAAMGFALNASTIGMAISGILVALFGRKIDSSRGIWISLALLSIPTSLLSVAPNLGAFTILRIIQGLFMSSAFSLTLYYLGENTDPANAPGALAAYVSGNVASNLFGRLISAAVADHLGLAVNFWFFALLNLVGAALVFASFKTSKRKVIEGTAITSPFTTVFAHFRNASLVAGFGIGFCILFAFVGVFTYVNFVLSRAPFDIGAMELGLVYFVFLPSILTTPIAGRAVRRFGARLTILGALAVASVGLPLLLTPYLDAVLAGLVLVAIGAFFAQAATTGVVGRAAGDDRGSAGSIYLACYFLGGIVSSIVLGHLFDHVGWAACVFGVAVMLGIAGLLTFRLGSIAEQERFADR